MDKTAIKLYNDILDEHIIVNTLDSGLRCYNIPKKGYVDKQCMIFINYGSCDSDFLINGDICKTPKGIAHYLEHKLFDTKNGNAFDEFSKFGSYVNAFTSFNVTSYLFSSYSNFKENIDLLFKTVSEPYFTDETVEKEKGIISQEIRMYEDNPSWKVYFNMLDCLYHEHPAKHSISGDIESISKIDKDILYKCYDSFYTPKNMYVVSSGDIDESEIYMAAEKYYKEAKQNNEITRIKYNEPNNVRSNYIEEKMQVSRPIFLIGFKDMEFYNLINSVDQNTYIKRMSERLAAIKVMWDIFIGDSSSLKNRLYNENLADNTLSFEYISGKDYGLSAISGESNNPQRLLDICMEESEKMKNNKMPQDRFEIIKKKNIGRCIKGFNSIDSIAYAQGELTSKGLNLFDLFDAYKNLDIEYVNELFENCFNKDKITLSVILPQS